MAKRKKADPNNKNLSEFLETLNIEEDKRKQIVEYVENLTWQQISQKPQLRLKK